MCQTPVRHTTTFVSLRSFSPNTNVARSSFAASAAVLERTDAAAASSEFRSLSLGTELLSAIVDLRLKTPTEIQVNYWHGRLLTRVAEMHSVLTEQAPHAAGCCSPRDSEGRRRFAGLSYRLRENLGVFAAPGRDCFAALTHSQCGGCFVLSLESSSADQNAQGRGEEQRSCGKA